MSWGIPQVTASVDEIQTALSAAAADYLDNSAISDDAADQVAACISAAVTLISTGAVGHGKISVSMGGHANADHVPTAGWANDVVTLTISCADDPQLVGDEPSDLQYADG